MMANSLYQQLNSNTNPLVNAFKMMKCARNPQQMLNNMVQNNPQIKQAIDLINNSGKSPKDLFYEMAKQKGVDPNQILSMFN